ncbi:DNA topoisomerase III [Pseudoalteromonas sp. CNC9-20]|uniref:DNA topoisomerase III n=1 Tax=Pseudoalteromonas sp. CNC9-20 TaxID=2917750 RepID=UPI001EF5795D|nr:DNA topoisomerase III [Pseudoalteromonas sp. CNC9-20]MCG7570303.1 DNA topoisomerase III [Pseudoalteromonas sp. CNC9-20]
MKLYIAEKPSLGRAIAAALPKPQQKKEGYIEVGNGDCVTWCIGHLLEQAEPDDYDPAFKKWQLAHLPIVPKQWQLKAKSKTRKQLTLVKKLIKQAHTLVHAGDPDREGQLLVDEVINQVSLSQHKKQAVERLLISDLNLPAVKKALNQLQPNTRFVPLSVSALARSRADWLFGMNLTRAYTLAGQKSGYRGVLSVGRVQTPVLGLVVARDKEIAEFVSKPFYEVHAQVTTAQGESFWLKWQPSEACRAYQDEQGRVLLRKLAENVVGRIVGQPASVTDLSKEQKQEQAPLPYNLSALQIDAAKRFSLSAKAVLDCCQSLYEKHKLITYPRSDNRYLPKEHFADASNIINAVLNNGVFSAQQLTAVDSNKKSRCFNDSKVAAHHAIVPTAKHTAAQLNDNERKVYELICRQYLIQFMPAYRYYQSDVEVTIAGGKFTTKAREDIDLGFKELMGKKAKQDEQCLPPLTLGQLLQCDDARIDDKQTTPPAHFSDATLLSAMTSIGRYVKDTQLRKVLRDTDGLGTEATRASIIELLFSRGFLTRKGKSICASEAGSALISALPEQLATPDMTAHWEMALAKIAEQELKYQDFMQPLTTQLSDLVNQAKNYDAGVFSNIKGPAKRALRGGKRKRARSYKAKGASKAQA